MGPIISRIAAAILTPVVLRLWSRVAPPSRLTEFDEFGHERLRQRNNWIDVIGQFLSLGGLATAFPFYFGEVKSESFWPLGMGFGFMVIFPVTFFWLATIRGGSQRWLEFWRYYEIKWGISVGGLKWIFVPISVLGIISLANVIYEI